MNKFLTTVKAEWIAHKIYIILAFILALIIIYYIAWKHPKPVEPFKPVPPIPAVVKWKIKYVPVPVEGGKVMTLDKAAVVKHVPGLPADFINNPKKHLLELVASILADM